MEKIILKHPNFVNHALITDENTLYIEESQRPATIVKRVGSKLFKVIDNGNVLTLAYDPLSENYWVLDEWFNPLFNTTMPQLGLVYSKKLKFVCFCIARNAVSSIYRTALAADGHIKEGDESLGEGRSVWLTEAAKKQNCMICNQHNLIRSVDTMFPGFTKFIIVQRHEYDRLASTYNFVRSIKTYGYFNHNLDDTDLFVQMKRWTPMLGTNIYKNDPIFLSQDLTISRGYNYFYDMRKVETVNVDLKTEDLDVWFENKFGTKILRANVNKGDKPYTAEHISKGWFDNENEYEKRYTSAGY